MRNLAIAGVGVVGVTAFSVWLDHAGVPLVWLVGIWAFAALLVVIVTLLPRGRGEGLSWLQLEDRFKDLRKKELEQVRSVLSFLSAVTRAESGGESWMLTGGSEATRAEANRLCRIGGRKLKMVKWELSPEVAQATDDFNRWLYFVAEAGKHTRHLHSSSSGEGIVPSERSDYWLHNTMVEDSIAACVECIARES
jgi:hypothetical protein